MLKSKIVFYFVCFIFFGCAFGANRTAAQAVAYRQTNLASSVPNAANNLAPGLLNPWGIGFLSGQPFFISENQGGHVTAFDATGFGARPGDFAIPNAAGTGFDHPTGIVADQNSFFADRTVVNPFIVVTEEGGIFTWGPDLNGNLPQQATLRRRIVSEVYKGAAILNSPQASPALAVTDFNHANIETFLPGFAQVALAGSFTDPNLPAGFAPFGIQVIGNQVFVTYALQDAAKHDPIPGAGNGVVSIFDLNGNFIKRFATGGALNAPWGIVKAGANFGPFSNDILIANVGDGNINAFDPTSGHFVGALLDGDGFPIAEVGLHALAFRPDGFGNANALYFTSQLTNPRDGLFGTFTTGLVSAIRTTLPAAVADSSVTISASVAAGPGNTGVPTGTVTFLDGSIRLGTAALANGSASVSTIFTTTGVHAINVQYGGDATFLPSSDREPLQVAAIATSAALAAPTVAAPGSTITLIATITSAGGIPTGKVSFLDGNTNLGSAGLDGTGAAALRTNTLAVGVHSLTVSYAGDGKFDVSTSAPTSLDVDNPDFSIGAAPSTATVIAGRSTQFKLTVTPVGGFANNVTFSCAPVSGVTCSFNPAAVTPGNGPASTTLTVTTSAAVSRYGFVMPPRIGPWILFLAVALFSFAMARARKISSIRLSPLAASAAAILSLCLVIGGCGGYSNGSPQNKGTATIMVTAQSGTVAHTTTVSVIVQ